MAYIILPSRRTQQPQTRASVNYGNSITNGIAFCFLPGFIPLATSGTAYRRGGSIVSLGENRDDGIILGSGAIFGPLENSTIISISSTLAGTLGTGGSESDGLIGSGGNSIYCERGNSGNDIYKVSLDADGGSLYAGFTYRNDAGVLLQQRTICNGANDGRNLFIASRKTGTNHYININGATSSGTFGSGSYAFTDTVQRRIGSDQGDINSSWNGTISLVAGWKRALSEGEITALQNNPWQLFAPDSRRIYFGASGGGATTTTIEPSKGSLAVAGYAPSITQPRTIAPSKGAATLTGYAPGIEQDKAVAPAKGALTLTGYVPTLTQPRTIDAVKGTLSLSGYAPGISQSASGTIAPSAGALLLTGHAPGLEQDRNVAPSVGHLTLTGGQPGIVQNVTTFIAPSKGALTATGYAPSVSGTANQAIAPTQGALLLGGYAPVLTQTGAQIIGPIKGALTLAGYAPTVQVIGAGVTVVEPSQGALSLSGYAPLIGVILAADAPDSTRLIDRDSARIGTNVPSWRRPRLG